MVGSGQADQLEQMVAFFTLDGESLSMSGTGTNGLSFNGRANYEQPQVEHKDIAGATASSGETEYVPSSNDELDNEFEKY